MGFAQIGMSQLATQYVLVPLTASQAGAAFNPTGEPVQFAFMPTATQVPQTSDWVAGSWDTLPNSLLYPYQAKCLVGPSGVITLGLGNYVIYLKITSNPEIPVLIAGYLEIT